MAFAAAALPIISAVTSVGGLAMGALGAIQQSSAMRAQGDAAAEQARSQASLYAYNAKMAEYNAQEQANQLENQAFQQSLKAKKILGSQTAAYGKAGVQMEGTPLDIQEESAAQAEFDQLAFGHEKDMALWRGKQASYMNNMGAQISMAGGEAKRDALSWGAGTTLLTGLGKTAMWGLERYGNSMMSGTTTQPASQITVDPTSWGQYGPMRYGTEG